MAAEFLHHVAYVNLDEISFKERVRRTEFFTVVNYVFVEQFLWDSGVIPYVFFYAFDILKSDILAMKFDHKIGMHW